MGFVGSNLIRFLNEKGIIPWVWERNPKQWKNVAGLKFHLDDSEFISCSGYKIIVHLAANVDTREEMSEELLRNNFRLSKHLFYEAPKFIYASSASVYGNEEKDFSERIYGLKPVNAYGFSKWLFDAWAHEKHDFAPKNKIGLRFFNVYGPGEGYKGEMASVVHKAINKLSPLYDYKNSLPQCKGDIEGAWHLFESYRPDIKDGSQQRDFIFVEDLCNVIWHFIQNDCESGLYNVGSGVARSFEDVVKIVDPKVEIKYVEMPDEIKGHYQYFTQADLTKLRKAGYAKEMTSLEEGIKKTKEALDKT